MNFTTILSVFILSLYFNSFNNMTEAKSICTPCENFLECEEPPNQPCIWGETRDICDRRICAKGPGQLCGRKYDILGRCSDGLMCINERCHGCSINFINSACYPRSQYMR